MSAPSQIEVQTGIQFTRAESLRSLAREDRLFLINRQKTRPADLKALAQRVIGSNPDLQHLLNAPFGPVAVITRPPRGLGLRLVDTILRTPQSKRMQAEMALNESLVREYAVPLLKRRDPNSAVPYSADASGYSWRDDFQFVASSLIPPKEWDGSSKLSVDKLTPGPAGRSITIFQRLY